MANSYKMVCEAAGVSGSNAECRHIVEVARLRETCRSARRRRSSPRERWAE